MRAVVHDRYGSVDVLRLADVPLPVPTDGEVLVEVHRASVNRTDVAYRAGTPWVSRAFTGWRRPKRPVSGTEFAGVVVEVGHGVSNLAVGDRVLGVNVVHEGTHAEYVAVPAHGCIARLPDSVSFDEGAAVVDGIVLADNYLAHAAVGPDHRICVYGASGSIGSAAVQLAKRHYGAHVTAVTTAATVELVRSLGADEVIDHESVDFTRTGATYDVVLDAVGKRTYGQCRRLLVPRGTYYHTDLGPGWQNPFLALATAKLPVRRLGFPLPHYTQARAELAATLLAAGTYRAVIDRTYPLDELAEASRYVETGRKVGNVVVVVRP